MESGPSCTYVRLKKMVTGSYSAGPIKLKITRPLTPSRIFFFAFCHNLIWTRWGTNLNVSAISPAYFLLLMAEMKSSTLISLSSGTDLKSSLMAWLTKPWVVVLSRACRADISSSISFRLLMERIVWSENNSFARVAYFGSRSEKMKNTSEGYIFLAWIFAKLDFFQNILMEAFFKWRVAQNLRRVSELGSFSLISVSFCWRIPAWGDRPLNPRSLCPWNNCRLPTCWSLWKGLRQRSSVCGDRLEISTIE